MPPLGVSYLQACLNQKGYASRVMDINIEMFNHAFRHQDLWKMQNFSLWSDRSLFQDKILPLFNQEIEEYVNKILDRKVNTIGFSVNAGNLLFSIELAKRIKNRSRDKVIIFGGPHSKWFKTDIGYLEEDHLEQYKNWYWGFYPGLVDIFVIGEGEPALPEILRRLKHKEGLEQIPGTILYKDKYLISEGELFTPELDTLSFPDFSWADTNSYTENKLPILLSRGCIRKCSFCNDTFVSSKYRCRSAQNLLAEIKLRLSQNQISNFEFLDLIINGNLVELEKLCDLIIKEKINISWSGQGGIRNDMSPGLLFKMCRAGCAGLTYGTESFSDKVLQLMKKPYKYADIEKVLKNTSAAGIRVAINIVTGFPGEGQEEFQETLKGLEACSGYINGISSLAPCLINLGSALHANPGEYGVIFSGQDGYFNWHADDGNNYELRKKRVKEVLCLTSKLGIPVGLVNLYDENDAAKTNQKNSGRADILLVTLPPWGVENPPIGLGYLDGYIRAKGLKSEVFDFNIYFHNSAAADYRMLWHVENKNYWSNEKTFPIICELFKPQIDYAVEKILGSSADLVGFSVVDPKERITIELIKKIKAADKHKKIILGGPACSTQDQRNFFVDNLSEKIDYFVVGEGEETLYEIIRHKDDKPQNISLAGLAFKLQDGWKTISREPIRPLDEVSFPDYQSFDLTQYVSKRSILVEWSRGCLGRCSFCKNYRLAPGYRSKSAEIIFKELSFLKNNYGINDFTVCDNLMNGNIRQLEEVCRLIIKNNLQVKWSGQISPRIQMQEYLFSQMRLAGCTKVQVGVESGSEKVLKLMKKPYTPQIAANNLKAAKKGGLETEIFLLVGFPGETERDFQQTVKFVKKNARYIDAIKSINTLHLIAGTQVYENPSDFNLKPFPVKDWHYLWQTDDGNTYAVRKKRAQALLDHALAWGIRVQETNIKEGKELCLSDGNGVAPEEKIEIFRRSLVSLQELPCGRPVIKKSRNILKWGALIACTGFMFFYIAYFWLFMTLKNRMLLGGKNK